MERRTFSLSPTWTGVDRRANELEVDVDTAKQAKTQEAQAETKPRAWAEFWRRYGHAPVRVEQRGRWLWIAVGGVA